MKKINNFQEFIEARDFGELTPEDVHRNTYKYSVCGAYIDFEDDKILLGSIVEGVDQEVGPLSLRYPFELDEYWEMLQKVEDEAERIWNETHGCQSCDTEEGILGIKAVDPDCDKCGGEGIIR